jgi:hypothetical protein
MQLSLAFFLSTACTTHQGGLGGVGALEHDFLGLRVILPAATRFEIHWAEFPLFERIMYAADKSKLLFVVGDGKPILDELNAGTDQHFFELRHRTEELFILLRPLRLCALPTTLLAPSVLVSRTLVLQLTKGRRDLPSVPCQLCIPK